MTQYPEWRKKLCRFCATGWPMSDTNSRAHGTGYHLECAAPSADEYIAELERKLATAKVALETAEHPDWCNSCRDNCKKCGGERDDHPNPTGDEDEVCGEFVRRPCDCRLKAVAEAIL